jgi:hypothetical protein
VTDLRFCQPDDLPESDLLFLALPHGQATPGAGRARAQCGEERAAAAASVGSDG